jgi:hypothetical protein
MALLCCFTCSVFKCFISLGPDVTENIQYWAVVLFMHYYKILIDIYRWLSIVIENNRLGGVTTVIPSALYKVHTSTLHVVDMSIYTCCPLKRHVGKTERGRLKFHAFFITSADEGGRPFQALSALRTDKLDMTSDRSHSSSGCHDQENETLPLGNHTISRSRVLQQSNSCCAGQEIHRNWWNPRSKRLVPCHHGMCTEVACGAPKKATGIGNSNKLTN